MTARDKGARRKKTAAQPAPTALPFIGTHDFFSSLTIEELAEAQGVKPLTDPATLAGAWPEDEDLDEFLEGTYRSRRA